MTMQDATNNCEKIKELLSAYRDLELTEEESAQVERHLSSCEECTRESNAIETVAATLSQVPRMSMKIDMSDRLEALITAQTNQQPEGREQPTETKVEENEQKVVAFKKRLVWGSLAAAVAALLVVAGSFFTTHSDPQVADSNIQQKAPVKEVAPQSQPLVADGNSPPETTTANNDVVPAPNTVASNGQSSSREKPKVQKAMISKNETTSPAPIAVKNQAAPKVAKKPKVDATLDSIDETEALIAFSSDDNMFEECGISTDEDGLYAIKM